MHYYPLRLRHRPITALIAIPIILIGYGHSGLPAPWLVHATDWRIPFAAWNVAAYVALCPLSALVGWFLLHGYRCTESEIEETDPVLRTSKMLRFSEICAVRDFTVINGGQSTRRRGHVLVGRDGTEIRLIECLPIWPQILKHLEDIPYERQALLKRFVL